MEKSAESSSSPYFWFGQYYLSKLYCLFLGWDEAVVLPFHILCWENNLIRDSIWSLSSSSLLYNKNLFALLLNGTLNLTQPYSSTNRSERETWWWTRLDLLIHYILIAVSLSNYQIQIAGVKQAEGIFAWPVFWIPSSVRRYKHGFSHSIILSCSCLGPCVGKIERKVLCACVRLVCLACRER